MATAITVTGTLKKPDGTNHSGQVMFVPTHAMYDASGNLVVPVAPIRATLSSGAFSVSLYANDDPTTTPTGTGYYVYYMLTGVDLAPPNTVVIPYNAPGGTVDIADLNTATITANNSYLTTAVFNTHSHARLNFNTSGLYYSCPGSQGTTTPVVDTLYATLMPVWTQTTINQVAAEITNNVGTATGRFGLYDDNGYGYPGALLYDSGPVDTSSSGVVTAVASLTIQPGIKWMAWVSQTASATMRSAAQTVPAFSIGHSSVPSTLLVGYSQTGVTGALPATFTSSVTMVSLSTPRWWYRVA